MLAVALLIPREFLSFAGGDEKRSALLSAAGVVLDDHGVPRASFSNGLTVEAAHETAPEKHPSCLQLFDISCNRPLSGPRRVRDEKAGYRQRTSMGGNS